LARTLCEWTVALLRACSGFSVLATRGNPLPLLEQRAGLLVAAHNPPRPGA